MIVAVVMGDDDAMSVRVWGGDMASPSLLFNFSITGMGEHDSVA